MRHKYNLAKRDVVVILACLVLLLMSLGAIGSAGRRRAKEVVCLANLRQWGTIIQTYTQDNDGKFWSGLHSHGYWWPWQLEDRLKDWKANRIWFCPMATKPIMDENGVTAPTLSIFNAWGIYKGSHTCNLTHKTYSAGPNGLAGSYALNGYVLGIPLDATFEVGVRAKDGWRSPNVGGANDIPLFIDALRFDVWPQYTEGPADNESAAWTSNHMARCCINRHNGFVNLLFMDWSGRRIGLKELWSLKWYRSFDTCGPWTKCGGVQGEDWPEWMRRFKDY